MTAAVLVVACALAARRAVLAGRPAAWRRWRRVGARPRMRPPAWAAALVADLSTALGVNPAPRPRPGLAAGLAATLAADPALAWAVWLAVCVAAVVAGLLVHAPALSVLLLAAVVAAPFAARRALQRRRLRQAAADVPAALEATARSLRAGAGLHVAIVDGARSVGGPVSEELHRIIWCGGPLSITLTDWSRVSKVPGVRMAAPALAVASDIGGPQAAAIDGVAATLRQRLLMRAEAWALGAQARLSGFVIALAPIGFGVLASLADPEHLRFLLRTPLGLVLLVVGLVLDAVGAVWMARLTRIGGPP